MKKLVLAVAMGSVFIAGAANAAEDQGHGKINFMGSIIDAPCSIAPESVDQTVDLGAVANVALKDGGTSSPANFEIILENCDLTDKKTVTTTFGGTESANQPGLLGIAGTASGASIAITDGSGQLIKLGEASVPRSLIEGTNTLTFAAYLKGDGASSVVVPGEFTSVADFMMDYQ
jgi:type 1 fimbria pilin